MKPPLTFLEAETLARVSLGIGPWSGRPGGPSRTISQALERLKRKGFVGYLSRSSGRHVATPVGMVALRETFENAMRRGQTINYFGPSSAWARNGMLTR